MAASDANKEERPSTYFVQDRRNEAEVLRVAVQDKMVTDAMGGALPEQPDPAGLHSVLDVGCGSGGWAITAAREYAAMSLMGIDVSQRMVDYAREQAEIQQVQDRVKFRVMDALQMLELPSDSFDLVNMRFSVSFMRTWDWSKMLSELQRVARSGGIIRLVEGGLTQRSNSAALTQLHAMTVYAFDRAGHLFTPDIDGLRNRLEDLLKRGSLQQVQIKNYILEYLGGTRQGQVYYEDMLYGFQTVHPFLEKWGCSHEDYDAICQQALNDLQQPGFRATWDITVAWGIKR